MRIGVSIVRAPAHVDSARTDYDPQMPLPIVTISAKGAERLRAGHPWIYQSDIRTSEAAPGDLVDVRSERGRPLGAAFWSSESQISLRFLRGGGVGAEGR